MITVIRTYIGHRSEVTNLEMRPHGDYLVSCSSDRNVKLWDNRDKSCIMTFKSHQSTVNCVTFSPDAKWIASGDSNGVTKIWDISSGKPIHEFHDQHSIGVILYHPKELLLATGTSGKVVRFWDLNTWEHVCRTSRVTHPISHLVFPDFTHITTGSSIDTTLARSRAKAATKIATHHNTPYRELEGVEMGSALRSQCCIVGTKDSLRVWQWEPIPVQCLDNVEVHWNNLSSMVQVHGHNDLIGIETAQNCVVLWHVDMGSVNFGDEWNNQMKKFLGKKKKNTVADCEEEACLKQISNVPTTKAQEISSSPSVKKSVHDSEEDYSDEDFIPEENDICTGSSHLTVKITTKKDVTSPLTSPGQSQQRHDKVIDNITIPTWLKNLPKDCWTQSFAEAAQSVYQKRKSQQMTSTTLGADTNQGDCVFIVEDEIGKSDDNKSEQNIEHNEKIGGHYISNKENSSFPDPALSPVSYKHRMGASNHNDTFKKPKKAEVQDKVSSSFTVVDLEIPENERCNANNSNLETPKSEASSNGSTNTNTPTPRNSLKLRQFLPKHDDSSHYYTQNIIHTTPALENFKLLTFSILSAFNVFFYFQNLTKHKIKIESLWKRKQLNRFLEHLDSAQDDTSIIAHILACIIQDFAIKKFSLKFCYSLLPLIQQHLLTSEKTLNIQLALQFMNEALTHFGTFIQEMNELSLTAINGIDINAEEKKQLCKDVHKFFGEVKPIISLHNANQSVKIQQLSAQCLEQIQKLESKTDTK
ncbi:hypothetical protein RFI_14330 [Reticulomyxa filosa]|uniref:Katanin p80 subunit C-terminal domain-containing protein n=1 Tax=Reticulomyxa filosa TaxID=46433 RepID=X6NC36_RETFI|nr:hypothetical protein RFI_14330 [Reticulomyxa filosa]|eukprot:ETO22862.1 hypothetical protein RFI_14330 [Reticulomyxa filosa]